MQDSSTERVGRYQLLEPIGGGPSGSVARAKVFGVAGFERQFAIKRFSPELTAAPAAAQALSAAARAYGSLEHPRIARMSEFGVAQGQTFTAVELVAGLDVMRMLAESRLGGSAIPAGGSLALISQAARAVGYAHGRGLTHLGLSPTNVIVTSDGDVKVTDFGILAATITPRPAETPRFAHRVGYLAPEQLAGEAPSAATDVFVLGVIAYELVTGQRAFFGDTPHAIAQAILAGPPAEPPLPRPIVRVLSRCLARSQFERFPDARAFADALDAALRVAPVPGTRKDIGAQVKATLDRHAAMHESELSGMVALNLTPMTAPARPRVQELAHELDSPARRPAAGTHSKLTTTMPGLPPPAVPPIPSPTALNPGTMLGVPNAGKKPMIAAIKPLQKAQPLGGVIPSINPQSPAGGKVGLPAMSQIAKPASGTQSGPMPNLRQTQPGSAPPPHREPVARPIDEFGRPVRSLVGPIPGLGAPGRPASDTEASRAALDARSTELRRAISEGDIATLSGDDEKLNELVLASEDFGAVDEQTRPGAYARAESDFSDLGSDLAPAATPRREGARAPLQPKPSSNLLDDPPTARHDVLPEVHARGGLMPFVQRQSFEPEPTRTSSPVIEIIRDPTDPGGRGKPPTTSPPFQREMTTSQMPPELTRDLKRASSDPLVELQLAAHTRGTIQVIGDEAPRVIAENPSGPNPSATLFGIGRASDRAKPDTVRPQRALSPTPPSLVPSGPYEIQPSPSQPYPTQPALASETTPVPGTVQGLAPTPPPPRVAPNFALPSQAGRVGTVGKTRWPFVVGALVVLAAGGALVAWQIQQSHEPQASAEPPRGSANVGAPVGAAGGAVAAGANVPAAGSNAGSGEAGSNAVGSNAGSAVAAGANVPTAGSNAGSNAAGSNAGSGAGSDAKPVVAPNASSDSLTIASTPGGARVFIDGADQGVTPVKLSGSADRHTMALLLPGHELYVAEVDGHGAFQIPLKPVTPTGGGAGIKVIKCKDKARYYIFVDGKPSGMTCPSERIETTVGPHTVEVYDLVTETRRKWDINISDERLSYRVRVD
ncbi:hypothetical protein BH11MYX1_BH11MYX1_43360 [soil metagenome]